MSEMIHLAIPAAPATPAAKPAAAPAQTDGAPRGASDGKPFAAILHGKFGSQPADKPMDRAAGKDTPDADAKDENADTDAATAAALAPADTAQIPATPDPLALTAALTAIAPRPRLACAPAANDADARATPATIAADDSGKSAAAPRGFQFAAETDPRGGKANGMRDLAAGKPDLAAGVAAPASGVTASAAGTREAAASFSAAVDAAKSGIADAVNAARTDSSSTTGHQAQAADALASTLSMLQPVNNATDAQRAAALRTTALIEAPVGSPRFADEAAQRVTWMAKSGIEHAEIRVNPPNMGPIQVSIDMHQNEASINFVVTQADTRVAVEDSLHKLEAMLADSGIALAQANVDQRDAGQASGGNGSGTGSRRGSGGSRGSNDSGQPLTNLAARTGTPVRGLVDTFA